VRKVVLARAAYSPHEGRAKVFIVRDADELSPTAANALLKTLEEPIQNTYFVLTSSRPESLLPTIRSRTQRVRVGPLPTSVIKDILIERNISSSDAQSAALRADGSAQLAFLLADPNENWIQEEFVRKVHAALRAP